VSNCNFQNIDFKLYKFSLGFVMKFPTKFCFPAVTVSERFCSHVCSHFDNGENEVNSQFFTLTGTGSWTP
jgi:hypothetical protein